MIQLSSFTVIPFGPCTLIGKAFRIPPMSPDIPGLWQTYYEQGQADFVAALAGDSQDALLSAPVGYMRDLDRAANRFTYVIGQFCPAGTPAPAGYAGYDIPACTVAHSKISGPEYDVYGVAHDKTQLELEHAGYRVDWNNFFCAEVYTADGYTKPQQTGSDTITLDYLIPCIKK